MAELFRDEFTAANGTTLASRGYSVDATDSSATVQSNQARLQSTANGSWMEVTRDESESDAGILLDAYAESGSGNKWFAVMFRGGYALGFDIGSRTATLYRTDTWGTVATVSNFLPANPESTPFTLRVEFEGTAIRARAWETGGSEGSGWPLSITNSLFSGSEFGWFLEGFSAGTRSWFVDNLSYYDFAPSGPTYSEPGSDTAALSEAGTDALTRGEPGGDVVVLSESGSDTLYTGNHWNEPGDDAVILGESGADAHVMSERGGDLVAFASSGVDAVNLAREAGNDIVVLGESGTDSMVSRVVEAGGDTVVFTEGGTDGLGFTESGVDTVVLAESGVESSGYVETGGDTVVVGAGGVDWLVVVEVGGDTVGLSVSGTDRLVWAEYGADAVVAGESGIDVYTGVAYLVDTVIVSASGTDEASTDVEPLPRLSLVIPRVNELQWRALVDWAGRLVDALLIRLAPQPEPPPPLGFRQGEVLYYVSSGTFTPGDYPGLRAVMVECQGGGGAGGGAATTDSLESSGGNGGGAGGYARRFVLATDLASSVAVTVGAGGSGNAGAAGSSGGASSFGSHCSANGGSGGTLSGASTVIAVGNPGNNGGTATGDFTVSGGAGGSMFRMLANTSGNTHCGSGSGGDSQLGAGGAGRGGSSNGHAGRAWGGGGGGATNLNGNATARSGGDGGPGIVIVTIYY